ncbi:MAG: hypothetical protein COB37_09475 [Kordiimonadales bacterium]|nr:MAG: hypothetical protein COB37_09475 [Kordiimonadales bacterium]
MQLRILGCSGGISPGQGTTAFLVDDSLLIDAGTGVEQLEHQEMCKIKHLVLTHAHLDHISHLPFMLNNVIGGKHHQLQVEIETKPPVVPFALQPAPVELGLRVLDLLGQSKQIAQVCGTACQRGVMQHVMGNIDQKPQAVVWNPKVYAVALL